jgi:hypothetical protein
MDMEPKQITEALSALAADVGPCADISIHVCHDREKPSGSLYVYGVAASRRDGHLFVSGDTFEAVIAALCDAWEKHKEDHKAKTIRNMALAIIRLTLEFGQCSDSALRAEFDAGSVARWGDDACAMADQMASMGPFKIVQLAGANAA